MNDHLKSEPDEVQSRVYGPSTAPTLVYLPGLHGDWTLVAGFRRALGQSVRFVEITYPRTLTWSLIDYARGVEDGLTKLGIRNGWLLGESFGSQILWEMLNRQEFKAEGAILAGGFARHPAPWLAAAASRFSGRASHGLLRTFFSAYGKVARIRFRRAPETVASMKEFVARRTVQDCCAMKHRLQLVANNDPRRIVHAVDVPVYALTGFWDPIVPWQPVRRALNQNCARFSGHRIIWRADHNVLGTAPDLAAAQVLKWMAKQPMPDPEETDEAPHRVGEPEEQ